MDQREQLGIVIKLLASLVGPGLGVNERARLLRSTGMDTRSIADVLGTTDATVRAAGHQGKAIRSGAKRGRKRH